MRLYTCGMGPVAGSFPVIKHPCGVAANALTEAGYTFEVEKVKGFKNIPFTLKDEHRAHIVELTGQPYVPALVLDDGTAIAGEHGIKAWAEANAQRR